MPILYDVDVLSKLITVTCSGEITLDQMFDSFAAVEKDRRVAPGMVRLTDMRGVTDYALATAETVTSSEEIRRVNQRLGVTKSAVVVAGDLMFGMNRIAASHLDTDDHEFRVFRDLAEARQWLGVPEASED